MECLSPLLIYYIYYFATHSSCLFVYLSLSVPHYISLSLSISTTSIHSMLNNPHHCSRVRVLPSVFFALISNFLNFDVRFFNLQLQVEESEFQLLHCYSLIKGWKCGYFLLVPEI